MELPSIVHRTPGKRAAGGTTENIPPAVPNSRRYASARGLVSLGVC
ncbi:hypothetical protein GGR45_003004 [Sphingomonas zeae]|jgi:hypothetical protein|nr:hypothetical protein [Sphingomonas zeae]